MKIGLLLPANIWLCPFVKIYTDVLQNNNIDYEIIFFNRDGIDGMEEQGIAFNYSVKQSRNKFSKILPYLKYALFLTRTIKKNKYDKLIVFGPQIGIFLYWFLKKHYKNNFILDYRDLSIEQTFKRIFRKLLSVSCLNAISSPGYLKCLPTEFQYIISHNFDIKLVRESLEKNIFVNNPSEKIHVLTIGGIRDYIANISVVDALSNKNNFRLDFVGKGSTSNLIEQYVENNQIDNIFFSGYYKKEDEGKYIKDCSMLNIFFPKIISSSTILSNRFYLALVYKKPMIVTSNSTQGDYVEKYNLGLSIDNTDDLDVKIQNYLEHFDADLFCKNCNLLLKEFVKDYSVFEKSILTVLQK
jgi:hypothetical protein